MSSLKLKSCEVGPNYGIFDGVLALYNLFNPFGSKKALENCKSILQEHLKNKEELYFTDNGRTALYLILKSLDLPAGSEVLIQGFSCIVLPNAVWQAGYKPVLVDINPDNFNFSIEDIQNKITPQTKAIIVQHTFGISAQMGEIIDICKDNDLYLIEDMAHSLGAKVELGTIVHSLGSLGHAAFYSFGRDKVISSTVGGFAQLNTTPYPGLRFNQKDFENQKSILEKSYHRLPKMSFMRVLQAYWYAILMPLLIRPLYHLQLGKVILVLSRKLKIIGDIYTEKEKVGTKSLEFDSRYSHKLSKILLPQLKNLEVFNQHRQELAKFYSEALRLSYDTQAIYLRFPFTMDQLPAAWDLDLDDKSKKTLYKKIKTALRQNGVLVGTWYTSIFMQDRLDLKKFSPSLDLPQAFRLSDKMTLNLPTNRYVSMEDAKIITKIIIDSLKS